VEKRCSSLADIFVMHTQKIDSRVRGNDGALIARALP